MNDYKDKAQQLFSRGADLLGAGQPADALKCFEEAQTLDSSKPWHHVGRGAALHDLSKFDEAICCYKEALKIDPNFADAHNNLGNSLLACGRFQEAVASFSQAVFLLPCSPVPLTARATALQALGRSAEAEVDCRQALAISPDFAAAHWNLALNLLLQGRYAEGWQEYEWRWLKPGFTSPVRHAEIPLWDGSSLCGRTIVVHTEQGFGDALQFVRYLPLVARRGATVILECHPQLVSLFKGMEGIKHLVPFDSPLPPVHCHVPLLSLPGIFKTTLETIPTEFPYLAAPVDRHNRWKQLTSAHPAPLRVGLAWAGKSYPDPLRSCRLSDLAALSTQNALFFSLQLGQGAEQAGSPPAGMQLIDLTHHINDFADTAALIEQLDLVISIDTAVAHLAGALGKPVWLLLPFAPDWRWLQDREDSPWYPTMRLFRQEKPGEWPPVVSHIAAVLEYACLAANKKIPWVAPRD